MLSDDAEISALAAESVAPSSAPAQTAAPSAPAPLKLLSFATAGGAGIDCGAPLKLRRKGEKVLFFSFPPL